MCLLTNQKFPRISFRRIYVKKRLYKDESGNYFTPVISLPIPNKIKTLRPKEKTSLLEAFFGKYRENIKWIGRRCSRKVDIRFKYSVGFIHSLDSEFYTSESEEYPLIDAYIPPFTPYYYSKDYKEYCSTKLKLVWN